MRPGTSWPVLGSSHWPLYWVKATTYQSSISISPLLWEMKGIFFSFSVSKRCYPLRPFEPGTGWFNQGVKCHFPVSPCLPSQPSLWFVNSCDDDTCSQKRFSILGICPGPRPWFLLLPICTYAGIVFSQIDHGRFFEKMSFSQPRGPPEKVGDIILCKIKK